MSNFRPLLPTAVTNGQRPGSFLTGLEDVFIHLQGQFRSTAGCHWCYSYEVFGLVGSIFPFYWERELGPVTGLLDLSVEGKKENANWVALFWSGGGT